MKILLSSLALATALYNPTPAYTINTLELIEPNCKKTCAHVDVEYPSLLRGDAKVRERIQQTLQDKLLDSMSLGESRESSFNSAINTFFTEARNMRNQGIELPWEMQVKFSIHDYHERFVCIELSSYYFTGGAHGMPLTQYYSFDMKTGAPITLKDLVLPGKMPELLKIAEASFRTQKEVPEGQTLEQAGYDFEKNQFHLPEAMAMSTNGLMFYYNVYEIASYAQGTTELYLYNDDIEALLKPEWRNILLSRL